MKEKEIDAYKKELLYQLDCREKELEELLFIKKEYEALQKKYQAISGSKLGRLTLKYWNFRNRKKR